MKAKQRQNIAQEQLGDYTVRLMSDGALTIDHPAWVIVKGDWAGNSGSSIELEPRRS